MTPTRRAELGIPESTPETLVWGVLMEVGHPGAAATLFVLADGHASLYPSTGGAILGLGLHENIQQFVTPLVKTANRCFERMTRTELLPVPKAGQTIFYALTDSGIWTGGGQTEDLEEDRHPLSPLCHAGHEVLTQMRYVGWRSSALSMLRKEPEADTSTYGVLREKGVGAAVTVSIFALINGKAGVYKLHGGSFLTPDQSPENWRRANVDFVEAAHRLVRELRPTEAFPVPENGYTTFFVGTQDGILSGSGITEDMEAGRHPLSSLYQAGEEVIEQGRLAAQAARARP
jgi:hypothetical protein